MNTALTNDRVRPDRLHEFAVAVLTAAGMPHDDAADCADAMVWGELRGAHRHGVSGRLPQVIDQIDTGAANPAPRWEIIRETATTAVLDADGGWGQVAGTRAMQLAVAKARAEGTGMAIVRNTGITAALGWYATVAVRQRMIGMAINDTMPIMAPWGGAAKLLGNQAFAIGAPADRHPPLLFDSALAAMSWGGIHALQDRGETVPPGVALTADGQPTIDPEEAIAGIILPAGGHRGSGLATMWEVLTGVLGGGTMAPEVGRDATSGRPMGVSVFCLAIDPAATMPYEQFTARVDTLIDRIHDSPPLPGTERVRVPGERGHALAAVHARDGIPMPPDRSDRLRELGARFGVSWDDSVRSDEVEAVT